MRLLVHLVKNDVRRFRGLIGIWIALVAAGTVVYAWAPTVAGQPRLFDTTQAIAGLFWLARQLFRVILVVLIVHAHPTVGSTAFWMTRPIPPKSLFTSKVLLIFGLTVGLPAAGDLALGVVYRVPAADIALAMFQTSLANAAWVALLMTLAVPTRNLAQFAAICGIVILSSALAPIAVGLLAATRPQGTLRRAPITSDPLIPVVAAVILCAFLAAGWLVQYVRRNRRESVPVGVAGVCLAIGFATMTEPPLVSRQLEPPSWAADATLRLSPASPNIYTGTATVNSRAGGAQATFVVARAHVVLPDLPPGWFAGASFVEATVVANGKTLTCRPPFNLADATLSREAKDNKHATQVALSEALGVPRVLNLQSYGTDSTILFDVPYEDVAAIGPIHGSYRGRFRVQLTHVEAVAALPLVSGATFQDGSYRVRVGDVTLDDGLATIRVEGSAVPTVLPNRRRPRFDWYLRNRTQGEAVDGSVRKARDRFFLPGLPVLADLANTTPGVTRWGEFVTFRGSASLAAPGVLTREWIGGAELVVVRTTYAGTVERELAVDDFLWPGPDKR